MPFVTQQLAGGAHFTDREREVSRVLDVMRTAGRLVVYGERRMGKSSLIRRAAERVQEAGGVVLSADAWGSEHPWTPRWLWSSMSSSGSRIWRTQAWGSFSPWCSRRRI